MAFDGTLKFDTAIDKTGFKLGIDSLGSIAKKGMDIVTGAVGVATAAVGAITGAVGVLASSSLNMYADFEQLTGGVETLFQESADKVKEYADAAYKTAGLSANQYMETVTSFSASLLQGLGGDTSKAADIANKAIIDMSDNANKMGTDMALIQNAYQGFAKQNYTMLDNLKLGYGGTQAEMARLINDSGVLGDTMTVTAETVNDVSFDKIIEAIHVVQTEMGITGTTAKEAATTIEGSVASMKSAWQNLITYLGTGDTEKIDGLVEELSKSIGTAAGNILPRLEIILGSIGTTIENIGPIIADKVPSVINTIGSSLLPALREVIRTISDTISNAIPELLPTMETLASQLGSAVSIGAASLLQTISHNAPEIVNSIIGIGTKLIEQFVYIYKNAGLMLEKIVIAIVDGISENSDQITATLSSVIDTASNTVISLITTILSNLPKLISTALPIVLEAFKTLAGNITDALPDLLGALSATLQEAISNRFFQKTVYPLKK